MSHPGRLPFRQGTSDARSTRRRAITGHSPARYGAENAAADSRSRTTSGPKHGTSAGLPLRTPLVPVVPVNSRPFTSLRYNGREAYHVTESDLRLSRPPPTRPTTQTPGPTPRQYAAVDSHALRPFGNRPAATIGEDQPRPPFSLKGVHVSLGEWLAGPPDLWAEEHYLAVHYNMLGSGFIPCAHDCGYVFHREQSELFTLEAHFPAYIAKLRSIVPVACPVCAMYTCMICGQVVLLGRTTSEGNVQCTEAKSSGSHGSVSTDSDVRLGVTPYMHCPDLQALIIGMGLIMIERTLHQFDQRPSTMTWSESGKRLREHPLDDESGALPAAKASRQEASTNSESERVCTPPGPGELNPSAAGTGDSDTGESDDGETGTRESETVESEAGESDTGEPDAGESDTGESDTEESDTGEPVPELSPHHKKGRPRPFRQFAALDVDGDKRVAHDQVCDIIRHLLPYLPWPDRPGGPWMPDRVPHHTVLIHLKRRGGFMIDIMRSSSAQIRANKELHYRVFRHLQNALAENDHLVPALKDPMWCRVRVSDQGGPGAVDDDVWEAVPDVDDLMDDYYSRVNEALDHSPMTASPAVSPDDRERARRPLAQLSISEYQDAGRTVDDDGMVEIGSDEAMAASDRVSLGEVSASLSLARSRGNLIQAYEAWAASHRFRFCSLLPIARTIKTETLVVQDHTGQVAFEQILPVPSDPPRTSGLLRLEHLKRDIATLCRDLPSDWSSSIFVRADSWQWGSMRALIIGPAGTPYANGCFVFDIKLPERYVQDPPIVGNATTNGGLHCYSPRLNRRGGVLLNLLNTFETPAWRPGTSSLLDVLLAIQSEILREQPLECVPCFQSLPPNAELDNKIDVYTCYVRRSVVAEAIYNNIITPPYPFQKEIRQHFRLKSRSIRDQLEEWSGLEGSCRQRIPGFPEDPFNLGPVPPLADSITKALHALDALDAEGPAIA